MGLKVGVSIEVHQINGAQIASVTDVDTIINPTPWDHSAEITLTPEVIDRMATEVAEKTKARIEEYLDSFRRLQQQGGI